MKIYNPYIDDEKFNEILNFSKNVNFEKGKKGGSAMFRPYPHDDSLGVLYTKVFSPKNKKFLSFDKFKTIATELWDIYKNGGVVAPVLGAAIDENGIANKFFDPSSDNKSDNEPNRYRDVIVVNNAPGRTLSRTSPAERLDGKDEFYAQVANTFAMLLDSPLKQDIHDRNILFHPVAGFNCIDFNETVPPQQHGTKFTNLQVFKFLMSFIPQEKQKMTVEEKEVEKKSIIKEQRTLVFKLSECGIKDEHIEHGLKKINAIGNPTIDDLLIM